MKLKHLIVSRHPAAVEFIRAEAPEFASAPVMEEAAPIDVGGAVVAGNIPFHLASLAAEVVMVEFTGPPPRETEYGVEEMRKAGARLARYVVYSEEAGSRLPLGASLMKSIEEVLKDLPFELLEAVLRVVLKRKGTPTE